MSTRTKLSLVAAVLLANVLVFSWRMWSPAPPSQAEGPVPFGEAQAQVVLRWQQAGALPLTDDGIAEYLSHVKWQGCLQPPANAVPVDFETMTAEQKADLEQAVLGLIQAYSRGTAEALLEYMSTRGQELSGPMLAELKRLLVQDGGIPEARVSGMSRREVVLKFADETGYASHWTELVPDSGCGIIWRPRAGASAALDDSLGSQGANLFRNQTRFHHLFVDSQDRTGRKGMENFSQFSDVRFVVRHNQEMLREPSPYYVRFGYDSRRSRWQPLEMVHVPTISGASPVLLF